MFIKYIKQKRQRAKGVTRLHRVTEKTILKDLYTLSSKETLSETEKILFDRRIYQLVKARQGEKK